MNRMFITTIFTMLMSFGAIAGVKVASVDLRTSGETGYVKITLTGNSHELPDLKVTGKTIELVISESDAFTAINRNVAGAQLSASMWNGKAVVKAVLPYDVPADAVILGWKNKDIEIAFPRGKVIKAPTTTANTTTTATMATVAAAQNDMSPKTVAPETKPDVKGEKVLKETLNEDYLNNLMNEKPKTAAKENDVPPATAQEKADEVKIKFAGVAKPAAPTAFAVPKAGTDNFSFAGYAVKFAVFLAMVLGLFYGVVQLLKKGVFNKGKLGFLNNGKMIEVLSTTYVSPKRSLMIVKAHKQIFLVANSEAGLEFLAEMKDTSGLIKEGEKIVTGTNFDSDLDTQEANNNEVPMVKLKENIMQSTPFKEESALSRIAVAKDIVKFSDELKKKAKKLKPIEFN